MTEQFSIIISSAMMFISVFAVVSLAGYKSFFSKKGYASRIWEKMLYASFVFLAMSCIGSISLLLRKGDKPTIFCIAFAIVWIAAVIFVTDYIRERRKDKYRKDKDDAKEEKEI